MTGDFLSWPSLASWPVTLGGVTVTALQASAAATVLSSSRSSAIAALLRASGNPLASCDYWAVARPYLDQARAALPPTHRRGCGGRHTAAQAFCLAIDAALLTARSQFLAAAARELALDHRAAAEMAADAVACRRRSWAASARAALKTAADIAVTACRARPGAVCSLATACGTGACPFAPAQFVFLSAPAPAGRTARPPSHIASPASFSPAAALEEYLAAYPYRPMVTVHGQDYAQARAAA